jgi:GrpB-like predicted nucleotidyltransferase (UPF0157 family)
VERHPSLDDRFDPAVRIVEHDIAWPVRAAEELRRLAEALGPVAVRLEHVGSTAVPGLAAKPILDLQLSVAAIEPRARYAQPLERLGYLFVPAPESPDYQRGGPLRRPQAPGRGTAPARPARLHRGQGPVRRRSGIARPRVGRYRATTVIVPVWLGWIVQT